MFRQKLNRRGCEFSNCADAKRGQFFAGLGANAVDFFRSQGPDAGLQVRWLKNGQAVGFFQVGTYFGQELVGRDADRACQARGREHGLLDSFTKWLGWFVDVTKVDVDFVDATIFDAGSDGGHGRLEQRGIVTIGLKVGRQQNGIRCHPSRLHQAHPGKHPKGARLIGGGRDHATPRILAKPCVSQLAMVIGDGSRHIAPAHDDRLPTQLGVAQQLNGCKKRIHVQVCDSPWGFHGWQCNAGCFWCAAVPWMGWKMLGLPGSINEPAQTSP